MTVSGVFFPVRDGVRLALPLRLPQPQRYGQQQALAVGCISLLLHDHRSVVVHGEITRNLICSRYERGYLAYLTYGWKTCLYFEGILCITVCGLEHEERANLVEIFP